jgi:hypothetical protein
MKSVCDNVIKYSELGTWTATESVHAVYILNTIAHITELTMNQINEHLDKNPAPAPAADDDKERLEVKSKWFSVKLEEINGYTLAAMAMILTALVIIVALLAPV